MFVRQSVYDELELEHLRLKRAYNELLDQWNKLVTIINGKGGQAFLKLDVRRIKAPPAQFGIEEIRSMIRLCHPDKHNGDAAANEITVKLLKLKNGEK